MTAEIALTGRLVSSCRDWDLHSRLAVLAQKCVKPEADGLTIEPGARGGGTSRRIGSHLWTTS